jgi:hypothetical protein
LNPFHCRFTSFLHPLDAFRSSNDDISRILDDQDHFRIEARDGNLEATAQSQEKGADDAARDEHLGASTALKNDGTKKEVILLTSSGGPPLESNRHVSMPAF